MTQLPTTQSTSDQQVRWTRRVIMILFVIGIIMSTWFIQRFVQNRSLQTEAVHDTLRWNANTAMIITGILVAVVLQLIAHLIRAYKHRLLIDTITPSSTSFAFQALSIGFLFNTLLPLRLGELIRAHVIGKGLHISRTVVLLTILAERAVDGIILLLMVLCLTAFSWSPFDLPPAFLNVLWPLASFVLIIIISIFILHREPRWLLKGIYHASAIFNPQIKESLRFIAWSALYGTKSIFANAPKIQYLGYSLLMWAFYIASLMAFYPLILQLPQLIDSLAISVGSYLSVSAPSGPAFLGTYHAYSTLFIQAVLQLPTVSIFPSIISSLILILPICLIATSVILFSRKDRMILFFEEPAHSDVQHKLLRFQDVSHELSDFLETYFRTTTLGKILSAHEISGKIRLLKTLTGGSNATTVLVEKDNQKIVRKTALPEDGDKLIAQYDWLKERQHLTHIPNVASLDIEPDSVSIEIAYEHGYTPYNEYIHSHEPEQNARILKRVLNFMSEHIYTDLKPLIDRQRLQHYIDTKILGKLHDTAAISGPIQGLLRHDTLIINGKSYMNIPQLISKITADQALMDRLATFQETTIHGDLTIENIIVNDDGHFLLLDPNNENAVSDPIVDYAKLYQSLHSGYEFLRNIPDIQIRGNAIEFTEDISSKYHQLFTTLQTELRSLVPEDRFAQLLFHEAVHYCRMLPYRVKLNPNTAAAFYAVAVRLFNEFYDSETR